MTAAPAITLSYVRYNCLYRLSKDFRVFINHCFSCFYKIKTVCG